MVKNYIKIAWRTLKRNSSYALINSLGMTLSITSAILILTFISFHLKFDDFHDDADRIYRIVTEQKRETISYQPGVPSPLGELFRNEFDYHEKVARAVTFDEIQMDISSNGREVKLLEEEGFSFVEPTFFEIFNYPLAKGSFTKEFEEPNKAYVTERTAEKYFGTTDVVGKNIIADGELTITIIGVLKNLPAYTAQNAEIFVSYITLKEYEEWYINPDSWGGISSAMKCYVKLREGVNPSKVEQAMTPWPAQYRPNSNNKHTYLLQPLNEVHFDARYNGPMPKKTLFTLGIIGLFLILTACMNFINLATAQVLNRLKEVGVRKTLGSKKGQLFWQFLIETGLLCVGAAILGYALAVLLLPYMGQVFGYEISSDIILNAGIIGFIVAVGVITTFVSGSYPGLLLSNFNPTAALKGKFSRLNIGGLNLRRSLIVVQFVISQVLIIGMLIVVKQMKYSQTADLGFDKESILKVPMGTMGLEKARLFKERIISNSNIEKVTACMDAPASSSRWGTSLTFKGKSEPEAFSVSVRGGDEDYIETFGLELVAGRNIEKADSVTQIMVNETFVSKMNYQEPTEALGKFITMNGIPDIEIVGVLKDFHDASMHEQISAVAIGNEQDVIWQFALKLNPVNMQSAINDIEEVWSSIYPEAVFTYEFVDEGVKMFYESEQLLLTLIQIFTGIAIFIGALGLYGLISFMVERKTKEVGVRKVLGSGRAAILWLFGKEFLVLIIVAFFIAAPLSWYFGKEWMQDFQFRADLSFITFLFGLVATMLIASLTVGYKAFQASNMDPVKSLRSE